jgi:hypothetical protein
MSDDIEHKAKTLYESQSVLWTGHVWDWDDASDVIKDRWRELAKGCTYDSRDKDWS